jgi:hypothetical protein
METAKLSKQSRVSAPLINMAHNMAIHIALEEAGMEFDQNGEGWNVRMRRDQSNG